MKSTTISKMSVAETGLEIEVQSWVNGMAGDYSNGVDGVLSCLARDGCKSGMVGGLLYYKETEIFFDKHKEEINELLAATGEAPSILFGEEWNDGDPLALGHLNKNLLAWWAFEETARILDNKAGLNHF